MVVTLMHKLQPFAFAYRCLYIIVRVGPPGKRLECRTEDQVKAAIKSKLQHRDSNMGVE